MKLMLSFWLLIAAQKHPGQHSNFPQNWVGVWKGMLVWNNYKGSAKQKIPMSLEIRKGDSSENSWIIRYGSDGKDERRYSLRPADSLGKHWIIDEKNGILLDFFHESNTLTGAFSVQNATLVTKYSKLKKRLIFEVISKRSEPARISGAGTEESPEIKTYKITAIRSAELKKID